MVSNYLIISYFRNNLNITSSNEYTIKRAVYRAFIVSLSFCCLIYSKIILQDIFLRARFYDQVETPENN